MCVTELIYVKELQYVFMLLKGPMLIWPSNLSEDAAKDHPRNFSPRWVVMKLGVGWEGGERGGDTMRRTLSAPVGQYVASTGYLCACVLLSNLYDQPLSYSVEKYLHIQENLLQPSWNKLKCLTGQMILTIGGRWIWAGPVLRQRLPWLVARFLNCGVQYFSTGLTSPGNQNQNIFWSLFSGMPSCFWNAVDWVAHLVRIVPVEKSDASSTNSTILSYREGCFCYISLHLPK